MRAWSIIRRMHPSPHSGDSSGCSGILLTGMLEEYLVDENGNQIIINHLRSGDVFGAESVCAGQVASHVYIHTVEKSKILMLDFAALLSEKHFPAPAVCRSPPI